MGVEVLHSQITATSHLVKHGISLLHHTRPLPNVCFFIYCPVNTLVLNRQAAARQRKILSFMTSLNETKKAFEERAVRSSFSSGRKSFCTRFAFTYILSLWLSSQNETKTSKFEIDRNLLSFKAGGKVKGKPPYLLRSAFCRKILRNRALSLAPVHQHLNSPAIRLLRPLKVVVFKHLSSSDHFSSILDQCKHSDPVITIYEIQSQSAELLIPSRVK